MNNINKNLERYQQQIIRKQRLENMTKIMLKEKQELELGMNEISEWLFESENEKNMFSGITLSSMYYEIAGKNKERIDSDTKEKYVAMIKYDLMRNDLSNLNKNIMQSYNELSCLWGCEKKYIDSIVAAANYVKDFNMEYGEDYMELENKIIYLNGQKKEMSSAIESAQVATRAISSVKIGIDSVKSWGTIESARGNIDVLNKKKQYIDNTQKSVYRMQLCIRKLATELNDVNISIVDQVTISEFTKFAEFFLVGLIIENDLQSHILESQCQIKQIFDKVNSIIKLLKDKCVIIDEETCRLNKKCKEISNRTEVA